MKRTAISIVLACLVLAITGCLSPVPRPLLSPPEWIHGTWGDEYGFTTYTFTNTTVIYQVGNVSMDIAEFCRSTDTPVSENATASTYSYTAVMAEGAGTTTMAFAKAPGDTLEMTTSTSGMTIGPVLLYRL